jgi:flagellar motor switch protein FliM
MDADLSMTGSEVLSQNEVERLLAQVAEQETSSTIHQFDGAKKQQPKESIQPYDFRNPVYLSPNDLRRLRIQHEEYIRALAARLAIYLRMDFSIQMSQLQTLTYQKFTESLANPTHLTLFKVEPFRGVCLLDVSPRLGLTIVDRMMGGPGHSVNANRDLSEIEISLLNQILQLVLGEWCNHWAEFQELRPIILGHETNGRFVQTNQTDSVMLVLGMEARMSDCMEQMQIAFPYSTIEPLIRKLCLKLNPDAEINAQEKAAAPKWNRQLSEVPIPITAEWPPITCTAAQLGKLKVGDFMEVNADLLNQVQLRLANTTKFAGRLGMCGRNWAVEVTQIIKT